MRVFVTGATGFVGMALCHALREHGDAVIAGVRASPRRAVDGHGYSTAIIGDIATQPIAAELFAGVDAVVHLASRVHVMHETDADPLIAFRRTNVDGTLKLARAAAQAGVRRFVFLSSIKVNGEVTSDHPFDMFSVPAPQDPYGLSKLEAETGLLHLGQEAGMEIVIIRPPLVYGPGVGANFLRLMRLVASGLPLPLAAVNNLRSMVYIGNLIDLIRVCLTHPQAAGETFLVSDNEDVSTPELMRRMAVALEAPSRLFRFPTTALTWFAHCIGKGSEADRLLGSLQVDASHVFQRLGWTPPISLDMGLLDTALWFRRRGER